MTLDELIAKTLEGVQVLNSRGDMDDYDPPRAPRLEFTTHLNEGPGFSASCGGFHIMDSRPAQALEKLHAKVLQELENRAAELNERKGKLLAALERVK